MYGLIKTYKVGNLVRVITSGCVTAIESLSIFVKKSLYSQVLNIESRVKDRSEMLTIINNLYKSNALTSNCRLLNFDIINMFPSIADVSGLKAIQNIFNARQDRLSPMALLKLLNYA